MLKSLKFKSTAGDGCHMDVDWLMECMWAHIEHVCNTFPLGWVFRWLLRFILYAVDFMLIISCSSYACFHAHLMSTQCVTVLMNIRYADVIVNVRWMKSRISSRIRSQHLFFSLQNITVNEMWVELRDLEPYTIYTVDIYAFIDGSTHAGNVTSIQGRTLETGNWSSCLGNKALEYASTHWDR